MLRRVGGDNGTADGGALAVIFLILGVPLPVVTLLLALLAIAMAGVALYKLDTVATDLTERNRIHAKAIAELRRTFPSEGAGGET